MTHTKSLKKKVRRLIIRSHKRFEKFTTKYPGFSCIVIDKSSFLFMYDEIFRKEIYKFNSDSNEPYIIDAGANIGLATIYFKQKFPRSEIVAFEPDPNIFEVLKQNIINANVDTKITCIQACLGRTPGEVTFYSDGADGGSTTETAATKDHITVPSVKLIDYIHKPVDFLKIDIEGSEFDVLQDTTECLHLVKNIFVEYHSFAEQEQKFDDILNILKKAGFRYYIEHIGIRSPFPYLEQKTAQGMDLQINIYGYRL